MMTFDIGFMVLVMGKNVLNVVNRIQFREWLMRHAGEEEECWVDVKRGRPSDPTVFYYLDAVEEALCFGWIDSTARRLDETHQIRRFTPRRQGSQYSRANIERLIWLDSHGLIHPMIRPSVIDLITEEFVFSEDIMSEIESDPEVWRHYTEQTLPYRRIRIGYIDAARDRPEEFRKRLDNYISITRKGRIITGYGGIDKYYR
jgi:hypothetical protein